MKVGSSKYGAITIGNDNRITKIGKILRKTKLDEIPQLINIYKGEMGFVGPRPDTPEYKEYYKKENFIENALDNYPSCDIKKDMELRYSLSDYFNENNDITIKSNHCNLFKKVFEDLSLFQIMD